MPEKDQEEEPYNKRDDFRLFVPRKWFVMGWWFVTLLRIGACGFLLAMTWLHNWLLDEPLVTQNTLNMLRFEISYATLRILTYTFTCIGVLHCGIVFRSLYLSWRRRQLTFGAVHRPKGDKQRVWCMRVWSCFMKKWLEPVFFIHGVYYDHYYFFREYVEVFSQTYQAYWMSIYIATRSINNIFVLMIFLNCMSTPMIHWFVPHTQVPLRRLLSGLISALLTFINSIVIPLVVFVRYAKAFDTKTSRFSDQDFMNDIWYAKAIRENQQLFVTSYFDFVTTWLPHWSLFSCLLTCEDLLRRKRRATSVVSRASRASTTVVPWAVQNRTVLMHQGPRLISYRFKTRLTKRKEFVLFNTLWIIGVLVIGIHFAAQTPEGFPGCKLLSTPWFESKTSCVIMDVNCYRRDLEGNEDELLDILVQISAQSLFQLMFTHCPRLQVPPIIRDFKHLGGLDIYNCTMDQWSHQASLQHESHSELTYVLVLRSNFVMGIPDGLVDKHFPDHVDIVYFRDTNLSSIPDDLHESWNQVGMVGFEFCQLTQIPSTLSRATAGDLALTGNPLTSFDRDFLFLRAPRMLYLSSSTLASLPDDSLGNLDQLIELQLEYTQISTVPQYVRQWFQDQASNRKVHSLFGSPYCTASCSAGFDQEEQEYRRQVCAEDHQSEDGYFSSTAIEIIVSQREL